MPGLCCARRKPKPAEKFYCHPSQEGSWSIKSVLPTIVPDLSYENLVGVKDGSMAMEAYVEAINSKTPLERYEKIREELLAYCKLDTYAMVRIWKFLPVGKIWSSEGVIKTPRQP